MKARPKQTDSHESLERSVASTLVPVPASMSEWGLAHVFKHYVGDSQNPGLLWYLAKIVGEDTSPALQASLTAVGLANISSIRKSSRFIDSARESYSEALIAVSKDLQDEVRCRSDSTLAAVIMLSMYEVRGHFAPVAYLL